MKRSIGCLLLTVLLGVSRAHADSIEAAGNFLQYAMPVTAAGVTVVHEDWEGTLRCAGAFVVQGVTVQALKSTVCSAEFLRARYGWAYGAPAYALAAFTGYSRVESDHHYWHDVIAGAGIGILSSWLFSYHMKQWDIAPSSDGKSIGLTLAHTW